MRRPIIAAATMALVACSGEPSETSKLAAGKEAVIALLRDPSSAEFRNLKLGSFEGAEVVCGEVNSRNGFGGMVGFERFVTNGGDATMLESQISATEFSAIWSEMCP